MKMSDRIPREKFNQWHEALGKTGARYLCQPLIGATEVYVQIQCSNKDGEFLSSVKSRLSTSIIEKKTPWWKKYLNKFRRIEEWILQMTG